MTDTPPRILIVDDDPGVLRAVTRVLGRTYEVRATDRSTDAARLAREFRPDLAICDVRMPELDGFELLDHLRRAAPGIDVILMTGSLTDQDTHLIRSLRERVFYFILKPFERDVLLALVDRCLESRRLRAAERRHLGRIEQELTTARAFQRAMLPTEHQCLHGVTIDARCRPCSELGGDLFDFAATASGRVAFIVADVRGHGVPAALLTGTVKSVFRAGVASEDSPASIAAAMVMALSSFGPDRFVTAFCGVLELPTRRLTFVNAGHPAGYVIGSDAGPAALPSTAPILCGAFPPDSWTDASMTLPADCRIFLHTDGLNETRNAADTWFSIDRVLADLKRATGGGEALDSVLDELDRFRDGRPADDDVTMMLLHVP